MARRTMVQTATGPELFTDDSLGEHHGEALARRAGCRRPWARTPQGPAVPLALGVGHFPTVALGHFPSVATTGTDTLVFPLASRALLPTSSITKKGRPPGARLLALADRWRSARGPIDSRPPLRSGREIGHCGGNGQQAARSQGGSSGRGRSDLRTWSSWQVSFA
jgi:hypothetical protein